MKNNQDAIDLREKYIEAYSKYNHVLTQNQSQIFYLYYFEDLSLAEISTIVATTRSNVHDTLSKAKNNLKPFLKIDQN